MTGPFLSFTRQSSDIDRTIGWPDTAYIGVALVGDLTFKAPPFPRGCQCIKRALERTWRGTLCFPCIVRQRSRCQEIPSRYI